MLTGQLLDIADWNFGDRVGERLDLLHDKGSSRRQKENEPVREPAVVVEHDCGGDEGFAEACRQRHQSVLEESCPHYLKLVRAEGLHCRVHPAMHVLHVGINLWETS